MVRRVHVFLHTSLVKVVGNLRNWANDIEKQTQTNQDIKFLLFFFL